MAIVTAPPNSPASSDASPQRVYLSSPYKNSEDRVHALVAGYQNHIPKPVDANTLAAAIAQLIARPATRS